MSPQPRTSLLLTDFAGHAFTYELAADLARDGRRVDYSYCSTTIAPRAHFDASVPVNVHAVRAGRSFEKYSWTRRLVSELRYGLATARLLWRARPDNHVVCNMPLVSLTVVWVTARLVRCRTTIWLQDVQSGFAVGMLGARHPVARMLTGLEGYLLYRADRVIAISEDLAHEAERLGVRRDRLTVLENWAPIDRLPERPKVNDWSRRHGLHEQPVLLYSGTLARKHSPALLLDVADAVSDAGAAVVVVSEGEGSDWLQNQQRVQRRDNLVLLPYQPFTDLPDVLGAADVLIVLLDAEAARFSVPSKTLSYLCSGRPILASVPSTNAAASLIAERARAGIVVEPHDERMFLSEARRLVDDARTRQQLGARGRQFAEQQFVRGLIAARFTAAAGLAAPAVEADMRHRVEIATPPQSLTAPEQT